MQIHSSVQITLNQVTLPVHFSKRPCDHKFFAISSLYPFQIIYAGKTEASQPRDMQFPPSFAVTQNPTH